MRYFPRSTPPSRENAHKLMAKQLNHWATHDLGWWAVALCTDSQDPPVAKRRKLIGWNGLQYLPETNDAVFN
jgi:hypothetical protein